MLEFLIMSMAIRLDFLLFYLYLVITSRSIDLFRQTLEVLIHHARGPDTLRPALGCCFIFTCDLDREET